MPNDRDHFSSEQNYRRYVKEIRQSGEAENEKTSENLKQVKSVIELIDGAQVSESKKDDAGQKKLLAEFKKNSKRMISDVLSKVEDYIVSIERMELLDVKSKNYSAEDMKKFDSDRTLRHNALIDSLNIATRYISLNLGDINEEVVESWEEGLEEKGKAVPSFKRIDLPGKIICPDTIDLKERMQVMYWALDVYPALAQIKSLLSS